MLIRNSRGFLALWRPFSFVFGQPNKADLPRIGHLADVTAPALLVAMAIGRIGDIIIMVPLLVWKAWIVRGGARPRPRPARSCLRAPVNIEVARMLIIGPPGTR